MAQTRLGGSLKAPEAHERLMDMATGDEEGLHWGDIAGVETAGYAVLALLERGDAFNASRAVRWLVGQRNAQGGFGSTQDTVIGLQALIASATNAKFDVDVTVELTAGDWSRRVTDGYRRLASAEDCAVSVGPSLWRATAGTSC